ncbi:hypothetical protein [Nostoc sp.]|uniref:hypothetical protein n=1 Tax=Nostoc sp. TaxID=1180 RepID=UPI002FF6309E
MLVLQSSDACGGLRQRREPPLNASSFKWGNPTNGLAQLCAIYATLYSVVNGLLCDRIRTLLAAQKHWPKPL